MKIHDIDNDYTMLAKSTADIFKSRARPCRYHAVLDLATVLLVASVHV